MGWPTMLAAKPMGKYLNRKGLQKVTNAASKPDANANQKQ